MELAILAQDIGSLSLALLEDQSIHKECNLYGSPEHYLTLIDETLCDWGITLHQLSGVIVVTGPGSFTASRVSTTIANALAFALSIPVHGIENPHSLPLENLVASAFMSAKAVPFVLPSYNRPAHITQPRQLVHGDKTME